MGAAPLPFPDLDLVMVTHRRRASELELAWLQLLLKRCMAVSLEPEVEPPARPAASKTGRARRVGGRAPKGRTPSPSARGRQ
jgi:hypothetical protein